MARTRNIKPSFFDNEELADLHPLARLLFIGLWGQADREGRLEDRPKKIKAVILPYDDCDVDQYLQELHESGFILRYEVEEKHYIQIINFSKHQKPHPKEAPSEIPSPSAVKSHGSTVESRENYTASNGISGTSQAYNPYPYIPHPLSFDLDNNNNNAREEVAAAAQGISESVTESQENVLETGESVSENTVSVDKPKDIGTEAVAWAEKHWGRMLAPGEADTIIGWCDSFVSRESPEPDSLVVEGLRQCLAANARNLNYLRAIMIDWLDNGVLTVDQVKARETERASQKEHKRRGKTAPAHANSRGQPSPDKYENFYL
ncbi:hypothetical protein JCM15765_14910 [Paradesulfitobacterium aromaticivorans]